MNCLRMKKTCVLEHNFAFKYKISTTGILKKTRAKLYEKTKAKIKKIENNNKPLNYQISNLLSVDIKINMLAIHDD